MGFAKYQEDNERIYEENSRDSGNDWQSINSQPYPHQYDLNRIITEGNILAKKRATGKRTTTKKTVSKGTSCKSTAQKRTTSKSIIMESTKYKTSSPGDTTSKIINCESTIPKYTAPENNDKRPFGIGCLAIIGILILIIFIVIGAYFNWSNQKRIIPNNISNNSADMSTERGNIKLPEVTEKKSDSNSHLSYEKDSSGNEFWFDSTGKVSHVKKSSGEESWYEYDGNGKLTYVKRSDGSEAKYDSKWNLLYEKKSGGKELLREYDAKGKLTYEKNPDGSEVRHNVNGADIWYNSKGQIIHEKKPGGEECWYEYDANGKISHEKHSDGSEVRYNVNGADIWYNSKKQIIHEKKPGGEEYWYEYDANGKISHEKRSDGTETYMWYTSKGKIIHEMKSGEKGCWYEYDTNNKLTYRKEPNGTEIWFNSNGNITHEKKMDGKEIFYEYDKNGKLSQETELTGHTKWYNQAGKVFHEKLPSGEEKWYEYNTLGTLLCTKTFDKTGKLVNIKYLNFYMFPIPKTNFAMMQTEVTQELYFTVIGDNPSTFKNVKDNTLHPVESVSWFDAIKFCNKLSQRMGLKKVYIIDGTDVTQDNSADGFRLPTAEEWKYAAKGGENYIYAGSKNANDVAWYDRNSSGTTHPVAQQKPNAYGLFDMSGNVWEWCWDINPKSHYYHYTCGGSWDNPIKDCLISDGDWYRSGGKENRVGFRVVQNISK